MNINLLYKENKEMKWKQSENVKRTELLDRRTANRKVYENKDHSKTVEIYLEPVHYQETDGSWKEMDDSLEEAENPARSNRNNGGMSAAAIPVSDRTAFAGKDKAAGFYNHKGNTEIFISHTADDRETVSLKKGSSGLAWGLEAAKPVTAVRQERNEILFPEILDGTDLRVRVRGESVKEDLILKRPDVLAADYTMLYCNEGLHPVLEHNRVSFLDMNNSEAFCVHAPCMKDADGKRSEAIRLSMENTGEFVRITFTPDMDWLREEGRRFPVVLDPVTTTSKKAAEIYDAHVSSLNEEDNFQQSILLKTMGGDEVQRSFVRFELPEIETGDMVINARLVLVSLAEDGKERTVEVHKVLQAWNSDSINWYNKPLYSETVEDLCRYTGKQQRYVTLDITRMVKDWYQNGGNYGLMFKDQMELSGYTEFLSSDCDSGYEDMRPRIDISYVNYSGLEDYWTYHSQDVGRAGTVHVNDYNGNLILVHDTLSTGGSRVPMSLNHVYNSNNRKTNLGYGNGFRLSYHQTLEKVNITGTEYYRHTDGDGTVHYFYYDSEKKEWKDESGLELTLTIHADASEQLVVHDKEENQLKFRNGYLVKVCDKNGNTLTVSWAGGRIMAITDGAGRKTTLSYTADSAGNPAYLHEVTGPSGKKKLFGYTNGNLVKIIDIDGETMDYTYDGNNMITSVTDIDGYSVRYSYYGTQPYRVKKITEYGGSTEGNSLTLTYGYNSTKFTDNKNRSEIYRFNNSGNLLHIHDGFGHAASAKYNRDGNHVNRLENTTKLQANVVQLLKDPIIQAKTLGWKNSVGTGGAGASTINTDTANCKVGNRSLKIQSNSLGGYVCWAQDVTLKKGSTYTASIYAKAAITQAASGGGAYLRVRYQDKAGTWHNADSEKITGTSADFIRLKTTFTLPADTVNTKARFYLMIAGAIGTVYGDMAQLETGVTASRCNLVDNGDFHLGSAAGYTSSGKAEDGITTVGASNFLPVQSHLLATAASAYLYETPSLSAKKLASVPKGTHLSAKLYTTGENRGWYRAQNASGTEGYFPSTQCVPYLGGTNGEICAAVGVSGAVLRSAASDTAAVVESAIPVGTCLSLVSTKEDSSKQKWFYLGMQIDRKRYYGYMRIESVIRLCINYPYGVMTRDDKLFRTPSLSGEAAATLKSGQTVRLRGVLQQQDGQQWYAVQWGGRFLFLSPRYFKASLAPVCGRVNTTIVPEGVSGLESHVYRFTGDQLANKRLTKILDLTGRKGDTYMVNAWGRGTPLPETDNDRYRRFGVEVTFVDDAGNTDTHYTNFSPDILDWQFLSDVYVAKQDYTSVRVSYSYCRNANTAFFDGLSLYREEFGQSYTYDEDNNLISAVDAQKNATKFEYNANSDLTGITDPKGSKFKYEYDAKHNVTKGTSAMGVVSRLLYDANGNITKGGTVDPSAPDKGIWVDRVFTSDKNHVSSVTDAEGNTTRYTWDTAADLLDALTDGRGNSLVYGYDSSERLTSVSQDVTVGGAVKAVKNTYTYTEDKLTAIDHNRFRYGFGYDAFGNTTSASIAGTRVVSYTYEAKNGNISKAVYGNGHEIRYVYDSQDRLSASYFRASASSAEQKLNSYVYGKEGELYQVTDHVSGKTYDLDYDFLGRLMRVRDEKGSYYEYTYDANNHMTRMIHGAGASHVTAWYTYDKDGREQTTKIKSDRIKTTSYDKYGRSLGFSISTQDPFHVYLGYPEASGNREHALPNALSAGTTTLWYQYDQNGNIIRIGYNDYSSGTMASWADDFVYDERNQLIREDSQTQDKTFVYEYDEGGNLTAVKEYAYTKAAAPSAPVRTETGTYSSTWKDQLLGWNGVSMTYDAVGNMLTRGDISYTWTRGRKLSGVNNGKEIRYFYDHTGSRVKKVVDGVTTEYRMAGDLLVSETADGQTVWYMYDSGANLVSMVSGGKNYFYIRNLQNDVIALIDEDGNEVVHYTYDSWGKILSITGSLKDTVGQLNPFRYRGYFYDTETGMYYLKSRYYDPELRRFISADVIAVTNTSLETLHNQNLYAYCDGNPLTRKDDDGGIWGVVAAAFAIGAATSIATQMVFDHKKITEINPVDVLASGAGAALGVLGKNPLIQLGVTVAGSVASSLYEGESLGKAVVNGAVDGALDFATGWGFGKMGLDPKYHDSYKKYSKAMKRVRDADLPKFDKIRCYQSEHEIYRNNMDRISEMKLEMTAVSGVTTSGIPAGANYIANKISPPKKKKRRIGWSVTYNGRTGQTIVHAIWA